MSAPPTLRTRHLLLRPFTPADAVAVHRAVGERDVAAMTASIPHPYPDGAALAWIEAQPAAFARGEAVILAITTAADGVVGAIGLQIEAAHAKAELGYWIGKQHWGRGFATEAARAALGHGFGALHLERIHARVMAGNRASARVLAKLGFTREGVLRRELFRFGAFVDCEVWSLLREEHAARGDAPGDASEASESCE